MEIKVFGPGCARCNDAEKIVINALAELGKEASVQKISDFQEMMKLGIMSTPAVAIDNQVKCVGKVPSKEEVIAWINAG